MAALAIGRPGPRGGGETRTPTHPPNGRFDEGAGADAEGGQRTSFYDEVKGDLDRQMKANRAEFSEDAPETRALFEG